MYVWVDKWILYWSVLMFTTPAVLNENIVDLCMKMSLLLKEIQLTQLTYSIQLKTI